MDVTIHEKAESDNVTTLVVEGEVDAYTAPRLRERLLPLCEKAKVVNLDLSEGDLYGQHRIGRADRGVQGVAHIVRPFENIRDQSPFGTAVSDHGSE